MECMEFEHIHVMCVQQVCWNRILVISFCLTAGPQSWTDSQWEHSRSGLGLYCPLMVQMCIQAGSKYIAVVYRLGY